MHAHWVVVKGFCITQVLIDWVTRTNGYQERAFTHETEHQWDLNPTI